MEWTKIEPPWQLHEDEQRKIHAWMKRKYPALAPKIHELWDDCRDYYLNQGPNGLQYNWPACFRRWIIREARGFTPHERGTYERPQEDRPKKKTNLISVRHLFAKKESNSE